MDKSLKDFFESQISKWELAATNFRNLKDVKKKPFKIGDLNGYVQYNPSRASSTLAKVSREEIKNRGCFLCKSNRPEEQDAIEILEGWELLVNPYPILPYHFTIVNKNHIRQELLIEVGEKLARKLSGMVVFYNDEGAGASAPDHSHFQAVPQNTLPLIYLFNNSNNWARPIQLPFKYYTDREFVKNSSMPQNVYFWVNENKNYVNILGIPRKSHRPKQYFLDFPQRRAISPGALDMGGILVTPFLEDFKLINQSDIENIYDQVGCRNE